MRGAAAWRRTGSPPPGGPPPTTRSIASSPFNLAPSFWCAVRGSPLAAPPSPPPPPPPDRLEAGPARGSGGRNPGCNSYCPSGWRATRILLSSLSARCPPPWPKAPGKLLLMGWSGLPEPKTTGVPRFYLLVAPPTLFFHFSSRVWVGAVTFYSSPSL